MAKKLSPEEQKRTKTDFDPPEQDLGMYFPYEDEGTEWFLNKEEAQKAYEATEAYE